MGRTTWNSTSYRLHQAQIHQDAKAGLDLGVRRLSRAEIAVEYPEAKQEALCQEMRRQQFLEHHYAILGVTPDALR